MLIYHVHREKQQQKVQNYCCLVLSESSCLVRSFILKDGHREASISGWYVSVDEQPSVSQTYFDNLQFQSGTFQLMNSLQFHRHTLTTFSFKVFQLINSLQFQIENLQFQSGTFQLTNSLQFQGQTLSTSQLKNCLQFHRHTLRTFNFKVAHSS